MSYHRLSRRRFLRLSGSALAAGLLSRGRAQREVIRIGFVLPRQTGQMSSLPDPQELAGEAAYKGAIMAQEDFGVTATGNLEVLVGSAPDAEAARRAAERLVITEGVLALVGGFGNEQASVLSAVAEAGKTLFFNIGSASDALRSACNRHTFHVEASAAMYLDALTGWFIREGFRRWFFVYPAADEGDALYRRARRALQSQKGAGEVGRMTVSAAPIYGEAVEAIGQAEPDVVLLLLDWRSQLDFLGHYEAAGLRGAVTGFPYPVVQTREFLLAAREVGLPRTTAYRAALWEATLEPHGALALNRRFFERWGTPMDPSAWAAYASVRILSEATSSVQTPTKLAEYLESPRALFDVQKGSRVSFDSSDHQLRQPLYLVKADPAAKRPWDVADLGGRPPTSNTLDVSSVERSDHLGDQGDSHCRF